MVATLNAFWPIPVVIPTSRLSNGVPVTVFVLTLIADFLAIQKAGGFLSVKALFPCSYCLCTQDGIQGLDLIWEPWDATTVHAQAAAWKDSITKRRRRH